jgi:hypothetical protein
LRNGWRPASRVAATAPDQEQRSWLPARVAAALQRERRARRARGPLVAGESSSPATTSSSSLLRAAGSTVVDRAAAVDNVVAGRMVEEAIERLALLADVNPAMAALKPLAAESPRGGRARRRHPLARRRHRGLTTPEPSAGDDTKPRPGHSRGAGLRRPQSSYRLEAEGAARASRCWRPLPGRQPSQLGPHPSPHRPRRLGKAWHARAVDHQHVKALVELGVGGQIVLGRRLVEPAGVTSSPASSSEGRRAIRKRRLSAC